MPVTRQEIAVALGARMLEPGSADAMANLAVSLHVHEALIQACAIAREFGCAAFSLQPVDTSSDPDARGPDVGLVLHWDGLRHSGRPWFEGTDGGRGDMPAIPKGLREKQDDISQAIEDFRFGGWGFEACEQMLDSFKDTVFKADLAPAQMAVLGLPPEIVAAMQQATLGQAKARQRARRHG